MFIRVPKYYPALASRGFTLIELLIVISIMSILTSISVPSFLNYINFLRLRTFRNEVLADINYLISISQKHGGNCNVTFNQVRTSSLPKDRFLATLKCFRDSAQIKFNSQSSKFIQLETNNFYIYTNSTSLQIGNHGALVGPNDYLFVLGFHPSFLADSKPVCFTLGRYNSSIKVGTYSQNLSNQTSSYVSKLVTSLKPSYCT